MTRIIVFGDTITAGALDYEEGGWVNRLRKFLDMKVFVDRKFSYRVYNLGISGDTTEDILYRLEFEAKNRIKEIEDNIIIFQIGINDSLFILDKEKLITPHKNFIENIEKLIKISRKITEKIVFIGLTPVNESKVNPLPWRREVSYKNEYIRRYDDAIREICKKNDVGFIDVFGGLKSDYDKLLEDGVHPNAEGHQKIFEDIKDFLIEKKMI